MGPGSGIAPCLRGTMQDLTPMSPNVRDPIALRKLDVSDMGENLWMDYLEVSEVFS